MIYKELNEKTALIIDDEEFMRSYLSTVAEKVGFGSIQLASSGNEALEILASRDTAFDFMICDLQMPEMDGVEVIRHLADLNYTGCVILVSGEDQRILETAHGIAEMRGLNLVGSLTKPLSVESLCKLLDNYNEPQQKPTWSAPDVSVEELKQALESGNISTHYQPQIEIKTGAIRGVETLARWKHPDKGMIPPDIFIDLAEHNQLIDTVTDTIVEQASRQGAFWYDQGYNFKVSINLSMDNLSSLDFPDRIAALVKSTGMDIKHLVFEVTESRLAKDFGTCLDILTRLRLKGPELSIDDFGTGYASMEHLKRMPFSELKIDRAFVNGAHDDGTARAILESSIYLAKQLSMSTVAEGVETKEDWNLVEALGCDLVQGYYIAAPMDAEHFNRWLEQR